MNLVSAATFLLVAVFALAGCGVRPDDDDPAGPVVQIGEGDAPATGVHWKAFVYRTATGLVCTQFRWNDDPHRGDGTCGNGIGPLVTREPGSTTWVAGGTDNAAAVSAVVRFAIVREPVTLDLIEPPPGVTDKIRYYASAIPGGSDVAAIDLVDLAGTVLMHQAIDLPAPVGLPVPS